MHVTKIGEICVKIEENEELKGVLYMFWLLDTKM